MQINPQADSMRAILLSGAAKGFKAFFKPDVADMMMG